MTERYLKAPRVNVRDRARLFEAKAEVSPVSKRRGSSTSDDNPLRNGKSRDTGKAKDTDSVSAQNQTPSAPPAAAAATATDKENGCPTDTAPKKSTTNETLARVGKKSSSTKSKKTSEKTVELSASKATPVPVLDPQPQTKVDVVVQEVTKPDTEVEIPPQSAQTNTSVIQDTNDSTSPALESLCEYPPTPSVATLVKSFSLDSGLSELTTRLEEEEAANGIHPWKPRRQGKKASVRSTAYLRYLRTITKPQLLSPTPCGAPDGVDKDVVVSQDENSVKTHSPPLSVSPTRPSPSSPLPPSRPTPSPAQLSSHQDCLVAKQPADECDAGSSAAEFGKSDGSAGAGSAPYGEIGVRDDDEGDDEEDDAPTRIAQLLSSVQKFREEIERCDFEDEGSANGTLVEQGLSWAPSWSGGQIKESTDLPKTLQREISWSGQRRDRRNQDGAETLAVALNKKKQQQHQTVGCQNGEDKNSSPPVVVIGRHATAGCSEAISPRGVSEAETALEGFRSASASRSTTLSLSPLTSSSSSSASHVVLPGPHSTNDGCWEKRLSPSGRDLPLKTCLKWPLNEQVSCHYDDSYARYEDNEQQLWEQHPPATRLSPFRTGGRGSSLTPLDDGDRSMERRPGPLASNVRSVERPRPVATSLRPHQNPFLNFDHRSEPRSILTDFSATSEGKISPTSNKIQVRARPELPAYLAARRRPTLKKAGSEPRRYECGALSDGEKTEFEFDDIEAILGELDFSKFRRGGVANSATGSTSAPVSSVPKFSGSTAVTLSPKFPRRSISHQATSTVPSTGRSYGDKLRELRELTEKLRPTIAKAKREVDLGASTTVTANQFHLPSSLTTRWRDNDDRTRPLNDVRKLPHNRRFVFRSASVPQVDDPTDNDDHPFSSVWLGDNSSKERAPYAYSGFATLPRRRMDGERQYHPLADAHYDAGGEILVQDEGLVADPDLTPDYAQTYQSVTSSSSAPSTPGLPRRGNAQERTDSRVHVALTDLRDANTPQPPLLQHGSLDRRKRFRGGGGGAGNYEPVKPGGGTRSLTYPPQRRGSATEDEVYGSVDSNGLRSYGTSACSPGGAMIDDSHISDMRRRRQPQQFPSELSLADSHLSPGEAGYEATFGDVLEIVTGESDGISGNGANGKLTKKKHYSDPSGEKNNDGLLDLPELMISCAKSEPRLGRDSGSQAGHGADGSDVNVTSSPRCSSSLVPRECTTSGVSRTLSPSGGSVPRRSASDCSDRETPFERSLGSWDVPSEKRDARSPQPQRRYSKKRLRGPYGEMLEEEMRKSGEKQLQKSSAISEELSFLNDLIDSRPSSDSAVHHVPSVPSSPSALRCLDVDAPRTSIGAITDLEAHRSNGSSLPCPLFLEEDKGDDVTAWNLCEELDADSEDPESQLKRHQDTRTHVVAELYDTEKSYVESLQILVNRYFRPLRSPDCAALVDASLVDEMFFQIPEILSHHENFLETLKQRLENWDNKQKVGDVFVESFAKQPVIDTYTAFINNWKSAKEAIKIATHAKPGFAKFLEHMSREHKGKLALDALLIMPVQRIPRYELLIKELLKHTQVDHPDHRLLVIAQKEVHDLAVKINRMEREAHEAEQMQIKLREMEGGIEGLVDLVHPHRVFLRHDLVAMSGSLGAKKERCLFLFSDLLLITSVKRKSGTIRRTPSTPNSPGLLTNLMEMNKYKLLMRIALDDLDVARTNDANIKKVLSDIQQLESDATILAQIAELAASLNCPHQNLDDLIKEMQASVAKQLQEKQSSDSRLLCLELTVTTQVGVETMAILFSAPEKRTAWEAAFHEAKQKLALSTDRRPPPEFMYPLPIRKTRAGLQFTCAAATLGLNAHHLRDVWVCNSDGYVGQVCVLSLQPEPTVASCNGVCNARILCIASVPAAGPGSGFGESGLSSHRRSTLLDGKSGGISISIEDVDEEEEDEARDGTSCVGNDIQLDSESSEEEKEPSSECQEDDGGLHMSSADESRPDDMVDNLQPTMWLGTEDGCIHVYNCNDNIRIKKNKLKLQHSAAVHCIVHLDGRVFVSLANGDLSVYRKDPNGGWETNEPVTVSVGNSVSPVTRMLAVTGKLWCGCQNSVKIVDVVSLEVEHSFIVSTDNNRPVHCMATSGLGVWISVQNSSVVRLYHATSFEALLDVNVAPAVSKMLAAGCDDIIRQHKAACLRVTALLACKDLLWVGTSAGVVLNLAMPHLTPTTTKSTVVPNVSGIPHGHTGHVRFLTCVEMTPSQEPTVRSRYGHRSIKYKDGRRSSNCAMGANRLLVISGGDGYEDFRSTNHSEAAGRDDSTNHLLLWQV